jgi:predicted dienelactone hydrolase
MAMPECLSRRASLLLMAPVLLAGLAQAQVPQRPEAEGPLATQTIEFAELVDSARESRRVPIKVHVPDWTGPFPVVVLSHGAGGSWDANHAQARHLASHGYVVLALEHIGSNTARMRQGLRFAANMKAMTRDADEVLNRPKDVRFALDQAEQWNREHPQLKGRLDLARVGMVGHSFGAFTTLVACGARPALDWLTPSVPPGQGLGPELGDARIKACVALSPQGPGEPFFLESSYATINRPVLGISGSNDVQQGTTPENRRRFFDHLPPGNKVLVWLTQADHAAFSDSSGSRAAVALARRRAADRARGHAAVLRDPLARQCAGRCDVVRARLEAAGARGGEPGRGDAQVAQAPRRRACAACG